MELIFEWLASEELLPHGAKVKPYLLLNGAISWVQHLLFNSKLFVLQKSILQLPVAFL